MSHDSAKGARRARFLEDCAAETKAVHDPIVDLHAVAGHLNPARLGASGAGAVPQSTVAFESVETYRTADRTGVSVYGGAEYGIVGTPASAAVAAAFAVLHGGAGAVVLPSGLAAIATALQAFAPPGAPGDILLPDSVYGATRRLCDECAALNPAFRCHYYDGRASAAAIEAQLDRIAAAGGIVRFILIEAPGSQTFEIADIAGIVAAARRHAVRTIIDNSWATHVRFRPIAHGVDIVIQAATKYEGGYADTPSGIVIARDADDLEKVRRQAKIWGAGAIAPDICTRLLARLATLEERLDRHAATADNLTSWFAARPFVADVLSPARAASPDHARFRQYFSGGNGLFSVLFDEGIPTARVDKFLDRLVLIRIGESWGGHVSLALPARPRRTVSTLPAAALVRFSIGLEAAKDLRRDLEQAASFAFAEFQDLPQRAARLA